MAANNHDAPPAQAPKFSTRQLSRRTWRDFERLFRAHPAPGAYPCWCLYNHGSGPEPDRTGDSRSAGIERRRRQKKRLVECGRAHGILVYVGGEPVGWCQYGLQGELPRIDHSPHYRRLGFRAVQQKLWRITCFVVRGSYRRRGVAGAALAATMAAIRRRGGGLVEAYPIKRWGAYAEFRGTASMFKQHGFRVVAPLGQNNLLVRRSV